MESQRHSLDPRIMLAGAATVSFREESRVDPDDGCICGETRTDMLVWQDDETVTCQLCGHIYDPLMWPTVGGGPAATGGEMIDEKRIVEIIRTIRANAWRIPNWDEEWPEIVAREIAKEMKAATPPQEER